MLPVVAAPGRTTLAALTIDTRGEFTRDQGLTGKRAGFQRPRLAKFTLINARP